MAHSSLNRAELTLVQTIINGTHTAASIDDLNKVITTDIRAMIPHQMTGYGLGELPSRRVLRLENIDFPAGYLKQVIDENNILASPVAKRWCDDLVPQIISGDNLPAAMPADWLKGFVDFNIKNMISHGILDISGRNTSYFCFAHFAQEPTEHHRYIIEILVPHLHVALLRLAVKNPQQIVMNDLLSKREEQVLHVIYKGHSNEQIAEKLHISLYTVKNHVRNILIKLGATNRTHAVAKALDLGIIGI